MTPRPHSRLARLQQGLVLATLLGAGGWLWLARHDPGQWVPVLGLLLFGHALVLGLQFGFMVVLNRNDPAPRATWAQVLRAWCTESLVAPRVFGIWQPFGWRRWPDTAQEAGAWEGQRAVVLIHGFVCNRGFWRPWLLRLRAQGIPYATVNLEPVFGPIDDCVPLVEEAVARATRASGLAPLVVCHSMGGLALRAWLRAAGPGALQRVHHVVTLGTPHRGTWLGRWSWVANGLQMSDAGDWTRRLAATETAATGARFTCWYSNCDNIVFPASTATLPGADNRLIAGVPHVALAFQPRVISESLAMR